MTTMEGLLPTAGERLAIRCPQGWVAERVIEGSDGGFVPGPPVDATVRVRVEPGSKPFPVQGWTRLSRDAWCDRGRVVIHDVATSGFDLYASGDEPVPEVVLRWRPPARTRAAAIASRQRSRLLVRAVLLQYPALWVASARGRAPLHAAGLTLDGGSAALLVGPSGAGKTTLVMEEVSAGGSATADNLTVGDGCSLWGVVEPVRSDRGTGQRESHGRRAAHLARRAPVLRPGMFVVLARGERDATQECDPAEAARALVASTYAAGELRRYWGVHALLAMGTGFGAAHPPVGEVAIAFANRLWCTRLQLREVRGHRLGEHLLAVEGLPVVAGSVGRAPARPSEREQAWT